MLTNVEIEEICEQLEKSTPMVHSTSLIELGWVTVNEMDTQRRPDTDAGIAQKFINKGVFMLLVLAAEGVPYDC